LYGKAGSDFLAGNRSSSSEQQQHLGFNGAEGGAKKSTIIQRFDFFIRPKFGQTLSRDITARSVLPRNASAKEGAFRGRQRLPMGGLTGRRTKKITTPAEGTWSKPRSTPWKEVRGIETKSTAQKPPRRARSILHTTEMGASFEYQFEA
jgi:hypothetical protein